VRRCAFCGHDHDGRFGEYRCLDCPSCATEDMTDEEAAAFLSIQVRYNGDGEETP